MIEITLVHSVLPFAEKLSCSCISVLLRPRLRLRLQLLVAVPKRINEPLDASSELATTQACQLTHYVPTAQMASTYAFMV